MSLTNYRRVLAELGEAQARRRIEVQAVHDWYANEQATMDRAVTLAADAVESAANRTRAAADAVQETDRRVAALWGDLRDHLGSAAKRMLGEYPQPFSEPARRALGPGRSAVMPDAAPFDPGLGEPGGAQDAPAADRPEPPSPGPHLRRARQLLVDARVPKPLAWWLYPTLPLVGAVGALLAFAFSRVLLQFGGQFVGSGGAAIKALAQVFTLFAPLAGLPAAKLIVQRAGARLDGVIIALTVFGGMTAVTILVIATL